MITPPQQIIINGLTSLYIGGAGGKGTWGKLGDEIDLPWVDPNDPNYDSDSMEGEDKKLVKINTLAPEMSEADVKKTVLPLVNHLDLKGFD